MFPSKITPTRYFGWSSCAAVTDGACKAYPIRSCLNLWPCPISLKIDPKLCYSRIQFWTRCSLTGILPAQKMGNITCPIAFLFNLKNQNRFWFCFLHSDCSAVWWFYDIYTPLLFQIILWCTVLHRWLPSSWVQATIRVFAYCPGRNSQPQ